MGKLSLWSKRWMLRSLIHSLIFNFYYLPIKQAIKLPIILYKPKFKDLKGSVRINGPISPAMIRLGKGHVSIYPNSGFIYENHGGSIIFHGKCDIGGASALAVGKGASLNIGANLNANAAIRIICYNRIDIGDNCRLAWETMLMDTDFHTLTKSDGSLTCGYSPISIGNNCWLGTKTMALKGTKIPPFTTVQAQSVLTKAYDIPQRCVIGPNTEIKIKANDIYRNLDNDKITYPATQ